MIKIPSALFLERSQLSTPSLLSWSNHWTVNYSRNPSQFLRTQMLFLKCKCGCKWHKTLTERRTKCLPKIQKRFRYCTNECFNYCIIALISHTNKVKLKILQGSMWTENSQKYKLDFKGAEELETKLPTCAGLWRKPESCRKTSTSASLTMQKPLTVWTTANYGKS